MRLTRVPLISVGFCVAIALGYGTLAQEGKKPCPDSKQPPWFNCPKGTPCSSNVALYSDGEPTDTPGVVKCQLQIFICGGWIEKPVYITPSKGEKCPDKFDYFGISQYQPTYVNCDEYEKAKRTHQPCDPTKDLNCNCPECKPDKAKGCENLSKALKDFTYFSEMPPRLPPVDVKEWPGPDVKLTKSDLKKLDEFRALLGKIRDDFCDNPKIWKFIEFEDGLIDALKTQRGSVRNDRLIIWITGDLYRLQDTWCKS